MEGSEASTVEVLLAEMALSLGRPCQQGGGGVGLLLSHHLSFTKGPSDDGRRPLLTVAVFRDEVEIEDFQYDEDSETYFCPCPCGDNFAITKEDLENGEGVAMCPSCSLLTKVTYDKDQSACGETVPAPSVNKELSAEEAFRSKSVT
ncbi:putative DPH3 homolog B [Macaca nemestrina]|uniref:putative DPH3 homolog B n=1 Tax=Macaca nemestrina TaxID=9545 RepID=UPI0039B97776